MDCSDHGRSMVRVHVRQNTVAEVEDMTGMVAKIGEYLCHFLTDMRRAGVKRAGIEVALQRDAIAYAQAGIADLGGPVEAQCIAVGAGHGLEPLPAALGENNDR